jgi:hypothetical protein
MKNYTYRITSYHGNKVKWAGGTRAIDMDKALLSVVKLLKITVEHEYYDDDSMMAGAIYRTSFVDENGDKVHIAISPDAAQYKSMIEV